jgi:hypothetical protein
MTVGTQAATATLPNRSLFKPNFKKWAVTKEATSGFIPI